MGIVFTIIAITFSLSAYSEGNCPITEDPPPIKNNDIKDGVLCSATSTEEQVIIINSDKDYEVTIQRNSVGGICTINNYYFCSKVSFYKSKKQLICHLEDENGHKVDLRIIKILNKEKKRFFFSASCKTEFNNCVDFSIGESWKMPFDCQAEYNLCKGIPNQTLSVDDRLVMTKKVRGRLVDYVGNQLFYFEENGLDWAQIYCDEKFLSNVIDAFKKVEEERGKIGSLGQSVDEVNKSVKKLIELFKNSVEKFYKKFSENKIHNQSTEKPSWMIINHPDPHTGKTFNNRSI